MHTIVHCVFRNDSDTIHHDLRLTTENGAYTLVWGYRYLMDPMDYTVMPIPGCLDPWDFMDGVYQCLFEKNLRYISLPPRQIFPPKEVA